MLVPDADMAARELRARFGFGSERGPYHDFAGTRSHSVPLKPPSYLEFLTIEDRSVAESTEPGRTVVECEARGFGLFAWGVRVSDLDAQSRRLGIAIVDGTVPHSDGTLRGWRTISGPRHLPFFIDYPNNGDRVGRWTEMYHRVGHTSAPGAFLELEIGGRKNELDEWLGLQHDLPLRFVVGRPGIRSAHVATTRGEAVIT